MKDISTPVPPNEVRAVIKKSLENAALVNYERLSEEARLEGEKEIRTFESRCQDLSIDVKNVFFLYKEIQPFPKIERCNHKFSDR